MKIFCAGLQVPQSFEAPPLTEDSNIKAEMRQVLITEGLMERTTKETSLEGRQTDLYHNLPDFLLYIT